MVLGFYNRRLRYRIIHMNYVYEMFMFACAFSYTLQAHFNNFRQTIEPNASKVITCIEAHKGMCSTTNINELEKTYNTVFHASAQFSYAIQIQANRWHVFVRVEPNTYTSYMEATIARVHAFHWNLYDELFGYIFCLLGSCAWQSLYFSRSFYKT